ncbi:MAG TPA: hypothetical protein VGJ06_00140 [Candidatus Acidoferrum sp.]|jgi:hypothetical protein
MKQSGAFLAIIIAISGILSVANPGGRSAAKPQAASSKTDATASKPQEAANRYQDTLDSAIERFCKPFGDPSDTSSGKPFTGCENSQFLIAILPDPVHTHLALYFDRSIEALQQAAQRRRYVFDSAILPWDRTPPPDNSDPDKRRIALEERKLTESKPGLLIFRAPSPKNSDSSQTVHEVAEKPTGPLFVLVVSETPTSGINREQFRSALFSLNSKSWAQADVFRTAPLRILGPTFSGSLPSLYNELEAAGKAFNPIRTFIYSGSVTALESIERFQTQLADDKVLHDAHFATFQENDGFILDRFIRFVEQQDYKLSDIALLAEDGTVYGDEGKPTHATTARHGNEKKENLTVLHFPREISYFRSEYQKENIGQSATDTRTSGQTTLALDLSETGVDAVKVFAGSQTALSQEAVMVGIITELQKHHVAFTFLIATDPLDELFLARYVRNGYPQGRVVVSTPDLLFAREQDPLLRGVLGVSSYALVPGLNDQLCQQPQKDSIHEDRLFVSTSSIGTFNATLGLLSLSSAKPAPDRATTNSAADEVPEAPYEEYSSPIPNSTLFNGAVCESRPSVWLTVLGRDGFWPVASFRPPQSGALHSTLRNSSIAYQDQDESDDKSANSTPGAWKIAYCICFLMMVLHAVFTCTASTLSTFEASAQFASARMSRENWIIAFGALALSTAMLVLLCARSPVEHWKGSWPLTLLFWIPFFAFVGFMTWGFASVRKLGTVATGFLAIVAFIAFVLFLLAKNAFVGVHMYWPSRLVNLDSGVSPVLPILLLLAAAYWWSWESLRGIALVDRRRPRLPSCADLAHAGMHFDAYHISDSEGDQLRDTAHPFSFQWQVLIPVLVLFAVALTVLDIPHAIQTVEGIFYDLSYSFLLFLMVAVFLGCLLKLVRTWTACREILGGLDRLPLRHAFSRMKRLSWHSMWNPGGSTLRETYKLMSRVLETARRLEPLLPRPPASTVAGAQSASAPPPSTQSPAKSEAPPRPPLPPLSGDIRLASEEVEETLQKSGDLYNEYRRLVSGSAAAKDICSSHDAPKESWLKRHEREQEKMPSLENGIEDLQKRMARSAAALLEDPLKDLWEKDASPSVSDPSVICSSKDHDKPDTKSKSASPSSGGDSAKKSDDADKDGDPYKCLPLNRVLAEEYVALVYVNFLASVLLRLRTMVICAAGMYVFIVLSINTYPFEPHLALQSMAVLLLIAMGVAVGVVYAQMHRDNILSRLTSSKPGELGWDFWLKLLSAGAIPIFSLLASQFPSIRQFLFSWLEPALQAVK